MSSVLHPVGPEPRERYWVRRLAVLVAAVVAIGIVIALVGNAMSAGSAVQAEPAAPTVIAPTLPAPASASPTPSASPQPSVSATPSTTAAAGATTAAPSTTASPTPGADVTPDPGQTAKTEKPTAPTQAEKKKAEQQAAEKKAAAKKKAAAAKAKAKAKPAVLATCPTGDLRPTLTGPKKLEAKKATTFAVSLINGSSKSCYLKVTSANFTLTVVSGKDRIWSTDDCPAAVPSQSRKLDTEKALGWNVKWDGRRSGSGCSKQRETPEPGYYWAIANFDDTREVRWRVILT